MSTLTLGHHEHVSGKLRQCTRACVTIYLADSCNIGTGDLSDMYARSLRAEEIDIRQITSAYVTTHM